jgi:hypothetical protein
MKNASFPFTKSSGTAFVVRTVGLLFVWLAVCPAAAQASPISYRIDYRLGSSSTVYGPTLPGAPLPTIFTYDPTTDLFNGLTMVWPTSTWNIGFAFSSSYDCGSPWCGSSYNVNFFSASGRQSYLADLLNGGTWFAGTTQFGIDAGAGLGGISFIAISLGNNMGDSASGTFTTTQVPEPSSLIFLAAGFASLIAWKFTKQGDPSV